MNATISRVLAGILAVLTISVGLARGATVRRSVVEVFLHTMGRDFTGV